MSTEWYNLLLIIEVNTVSYSGVGICHSEIHVSKVFTWEYCIHIAFYWFYWFQIGVTALPSLREYVKLFPSNTEFSGKVKSLLGIVSSHLRTVTGQNIRITSVIIYSYYPFPAQCNEWTCTVQYHLWNVCIKTEVTIWGRWGCISVGKDHTDGGIWKYPLKMWTWLGWPRTVIIVNFRVNSINFNFPLIYTVTYIST